jgi:hypothetical protein
MELTGARGLENVTVLASILEDAEGPVHKVALLEGELVEGHQAERWLRTSSVACLMHRMMAHGG